MKSVLVLALPLLASSAWADDLALAQSMMDRAMVELASHSSFTVVLVGKETDDKAETGFRIDLAYNYSVAGGRPVTKLELLNIRGNDLLNRISGDGDRMWIYDVPKNQYSSSEYGTAAHFGKERTRLFQVLAKRSEGAQTFLSRLMLDTFRSNGQARSKWLPWRPSSKVSLDPAGNIVCDSSIPNPSQLTYVVVTDRLFGYRLTSVKYLEQSSISGRVRTIEWEATIYPDWTPKDTSYSFVPPKGSRAVSVNEARGGG